MELVIKFEIFTSRWKKGDTYTFTFSEDSLKIDSMPLIHGITLTLEDGDPKWTPEGGRGYENYLMGILANDQVYFPEIVIKAIEHVFHLYCEKALTEEEVTREIIDLLKWINLINREIPVSSYWSPPPSSYKELPKKP